MVSKVIFTFFVAMCIVQATFASSMRVPRQAEEKPGGDSNSNNANAASGTDAFINNIGQMFGTMPKNPNDFITLFSSFVKNINQQQGQKA